MTHRLKALLSFMNPAPQGTIMSGQVRIYVYYLGKSCRYLTSENEVSHLFADFYDDFSMLSKNNEKNMRTPEVRQ